MTSIDPIPKPKEHEAFISQNQNIEDEVEMINLRSESRLNCTKKIVPEIYHAE